MTGVELKKFREKLKLTATQAAASCSVSERTWQRWEASGMESIPERTAKLISLSLAKPRERRAS
jgi:DNA-binding transcriptional regulator YiaG